MRILSKTDSDLRVKDIQAAVEELPGGPVSRSAVKNYLHRHSQGASPLFERIARGRYRLLPYVRRAPSGEARLRSGPRDVAAA